MHMNIDMSASHEDDFAKSLAANDGRARGNATHQLADSACALRGPQRAPGAPQRALRGPSMHCMAPSVHCVPHV